MCLEKLKLAFKDQSGNQVFYYKCKNCGEMLVSTPFNAESGKYACKCHKPAPPVRKLREKDEQGKVIPDPWLWYLVTREIDGRKVCLYRTNHKGKTTIIAGYMPTLSDSYHTTILTNQGGSWLISDAIEEINSVETRQKNNKAKGNRLTQQDIEAIKQSLALEVPYPTLERRYGVTKRTLQRIKSTI